MSRPTRDDVADFLYHEAELIDRRRFGEWLGLFTDDAIYWLPSGAEEDEDPARRISLIYDDKARLGERVQRISGGFAYAQQPPSRTCHVIGNVRFTDAGGDTLKVASTCVVTESRRGTQRVHSGSVEHLLAVGNGGPRIRRKVVRLLDSDAPLGNLTFLL